MGRERERECSISRSSRGMRSSWISNHSWIICIIILCSSSGLSWCYKERGSIVSGRPNKYGVLRPAGVVGGGPGERIGEIMSNGIGEPSCEELRAMWRYHKRQSRRAELTNQIPAFEPIYWQLPPPGTLSSFGPLKTFKLGRSRYNSHHRGRGAYGHINYFGPQRQRIRPMDELIRMQPPKVKPADTPVITQPVVHLSPASVIPTNSSFQQLQQMILEERQQEANNRPRDDDSRGGNYGTLVLSPPKGQDGRLANKPPEMMTPFEKLRFGHMNFKEEEDDSDNNFDGGIGIQTKRGLFYYPIRATRIRERQQREREQQQLQEQQEQLTRTTTQSPPPVRAGPSLPHSSIPSVFSFWRRQLAPQDTPPSIRMVDTLPSCSLVQGLRCTLNQHCSCTGNGLYRCFRGQCNFLPRGIDESKEEEEEEEEEVGEQEEPVVLLSPFYSRLGGTNEWMIVNGEELVGNGLLEENNNNNNQDEDAGGNEVNHEQGEEDGEDAESDDDGDDTVVVERQDGGAGGN